MAPLKVNPITLLCICMLFLPLITQAAERKFQTCYDDYNSDYDAKISELVEKRYREETTTAEPNVDAENAATNLAGSVIPPPPPGGYVASTYNYYGGAVYGSQVYGGPPPPPPPTEAEIKAAQAAREAEWKALQEKRDQIRVDVLAKNPEQSPGRVIFTKLDTSPEVAKGGQDVIVQFNAVRNESIPNDSVTVHTRLYWENLMSFGSSKSEFSVCKITDKSCPIATNDPFSAKFNLTIVKDVYTKNRAELQITLKNNDGFIIGCVTTELKVALLPA